MQFFGVPNFDSYQQSERCHSYQLDFSKFQTLFGDEIYQTHTTTHHIRPCFHLGMDQYLLIPFLVGWTSIYQLFWCSPGVQGFDPSPFVSHSTWLENPGHRPSHRCQPSRIRPKISWPRFGEMDTSSFRGFWRMRLGWISWPLITKRSSHVSGAVHGCEFGKNMEKQGSWSWIELKRRLNWNEEFYRATWDFQHG